MSDPKLFIGVANSQFTVPSAFHWSWERMDKPYEYKKVRYSHNDAIVRNNQMVRDFLRSGCDIFVKMDIDQEYPKRFLSVMVPLALEYKVVGPLIHNKWRDNGYPPLMCRENTYPISRPLMDLHKLADKKDMVLMEYSHTNLFIVREVLEKTEPPWYVAEYRKDGCNFTANRDFFFIDKIRDAGYETYINLKMEVGHLVEEVIASRANKILSDIRRVH